MISTREIKKFEPPSATCRYLIFCWNWGVLHFDNRLKPSHRY